MLCRLSVCTLGAAVACTLTGLPTDARAHGTDANQVQLAVHEDVGELLATPPTEFAGLRFADDNGDGLLSRPEMDAHRAAIQAALVAALSVTDADGRPARVDRADVSLPQLVQPSGIADRAGGRQPGGVSNGQEFVRLTLRLVFAAPPTAVNVRCDFAGTHPVGLFATRAESVSHPGVLTLVGDRESTFFDTTHREATVLRVAGAAGAPASGPASTPEASSPWALAIPAGLLVVGIAQTVGRQRKRLRRS